MVGSFQFFRKYQRSLLVFVAILAMLAFFVLPPILQQMSDSGESQDPVAVTWNGGALREGGLERMVATRSLVNRFLTESVAAGGRDPSRLPLLPDGEEQSVQTALLAQDAKANGVVVSDRAINDFLGQLTGNLVRQEQFDEILARLRLGPFPLSQQDLFEALRTELAARTMLMLHQSAFSGDPPGWQWDYFRRLQQQATVEVAPVVVEGFADAVPPPTEPQLRAFYEKYKNDLPEARSAEPGFREPHRVKYDFLVAKSALFEEESAKEVTDEEIAAYYEKNKTSMFRAKPVVPEATPVAPEIKPATPEEKPVAPKGASTVRRGSVATVSFKQPVAKPAEPAAEPAQAPAASNAVKEATKEAAQAEDPQQFEPLDAVKDDIRKRLARERADARIDRAYTAVAADIGGYAEDYALWQARRPAGVEAPRPPNLAKIAEKQGLVSGNSELIAADAAFAAGGIGGSFEFVQDASSRFGIRQQRWIDQMFGAGSMSLRPIRSRDVDGNRYLSWRTEDQPEFVPSFAAARPSVERAWRIIEARSLARKRAEEIAREADAKKQSLEATLSPVAADAVGLATLKATQVGPFSWLSAGQIAAGGPPTLSQPEGISMPGNEFMQAVFAVEPGLTAVAFNEPQTVCYVVRLVSQEPPAAELREKFLAGRDNRQAIGMVAQREASETFRSLIKGMEQRYQLDWKRQPRSPER
ncbi:MAG: hypothetical protein WCQ77_06400 [Planctomycetota bacterium]